MDSNNVWHLQYYWDHILTQVHIWLPGDVKGIIRMWQEYARRYLCFVVVVVLAVRSAIAASSVCTRSKASMSISPPLTLSMDAALTPTPTPPSSPVPVEEDWGLRGLESPADSPVIPELFISWVPPPIELVAAARSTTNTKTRAEDKSRGRYTCRVGLISDWSVDVISRSDTKEWLLGTTKQTRNYGLE